MAVLLLIAVTGAALAGLGTTFARYSDVEHNGTSTAGAATVVLGGQRSGLALPFLGLGGLLTDASRTFTLSVVYKGTVPADIQFQLPSGASSSNCVRSGTTWVDPALHRTLSIKLGATTAVPYCSLLNGVARTVLTGVLPGSTTAVPITVTAGGLLTLIGRNEVAPIAVRAVGGFSDLVTGTISITANGLLPPTPTTVPAPTSAAPLSARSARVINAVQTPAECTGAGLGPFAEAVQLTADRPRFSVAEDRPGATGPFLVIGTDADEVISGSSGADCLVGGGGADAVDGAGGDDLLLGQDGADRLTGGDGDDALRGAAGPDRLAGGPGTDQLDGGPDGAECEPAPEDPPAVGCTYPAAASTAPTTPAPTTEPAPVAPEPGGPPVTGDDTDPVTPPGSEPAAPAPEAPAPAPADPAPADPAPDPGTAVDPGGGGPITEGGPDAVPPAEPAGPPG